MTLGSSPSLPQVSVLLGSVSLEQQVPCPLLDDVLCAHVTVLPLQVVQRIFYSVNRSWSGRITCSELRRSDFLQVGPVPGPADLSLPGHAQLIPSHAPSQLATSTAYQSCLRYGPAYPALPHPFLTLPHCSYTCTLALALLPGPALGSQELPLSAWPHPFLPAPPFWL